MDKKEKLEEILNNENFPFHTTELEDEDLEDVSGGGNTGCNCNCGKELVV